MAVNYLVSEFKIYYNGDVVENDFFSLQSSTPSTDDFMEIATESLLSFYSAKYPSELMFIKFYKVEEISKVEYDRLQAKSIYKKQLNG